MELDECLDNKIVTGYQNYTLYFRLILSRNFTFPLFCNICIIINGSPYIIQSRRESRSKRSSILFIFLVIAYALVKAIDDNLLRCTMAATVAASGSQLRERRNPNYARACTLCIQYTARYLQNNAHTGLLCRKHAAAI